MNGTKPLLSITYTRLVVWDNIDGLVQERRNSIANALELRLCCSNPSICRHQL